MIQFSLDKKSPVPFYRQIADMILAGISRGGVAPGEKLPTIREMAVMLEVNPNTVVKAYSHLQMLGVLDTEQGSGVFVKAKPAEAFSTAERERALDGLCQDFVGRAQLLNVGIDELIQHLTRMRAQGKPESAGKN